MTRAVALELAATRRLPVIVPNEWGRFDYALPGGITAHKDTLCEVKMDLINRRFASYLIVLPERLSFHTVDGNPQSDGHREKVAA